MRYLIIVFVISAVTPLLSKGQAMDCEKFKEGKFLSTTDTIVTKIERNGNKHREINEQLGLDVLFDVVWLDDCTYELTVNKVIKDEKGFNYPVNQILWSQIIEVKEKSYIVVVEVSDIDFKGTYEIFAVE